MDSSRSKAEMSERGSIAGSSKATESTESIHEKETDNSAAERSSADIRSPKINSKNEVSTNEFMPGVDLEKAPSMPRGETESMKLSGDEEDPPVPVSFQRSTSPAVMQRNKGAAYEKVGEEGIYRMHKFSLYETSTRFYLVGADILDKHYRVLKIDRTAPPGHLSVFEDDIVYDKREMNQLLNAIDDGNKGTGGMKLKCSTWGLLGFIRFTEAYYMLLITKRAQVAMVGGHYIYMVDGTELVPLTTGSSSRFQKDRNPEEARFLGILNNLDLTSRFYFSYSYNITRSLQQNIIHERNSLNQGYSTSAPDFQDMFVWNHHLLQPAMDVLRNVYDWCHPIIHGYIDQSTLDIFRRRVYITIIARRSRFFAGARFLKRGANDLGYVANDVETEQIVSDGLTTSFHAPGPRLYSSPGWTSYVQHRGSIPLYWTQDNSGVTPKPDIDLNLVDPFYSAAALHFDNLFERYGAPVFVLNLIKARERTPRESKLLYEYHNAIKYLNQSLPKDKQIIYEPFDMARASKTRGGDVIGTLEKLAERVLRKTGFFHNGDDATDNAHVQNGVARTNCIDCLDRTNACQFVVGKRALGRQLQALGVIAGNTVEYDTDCVDIFTHMFHGHGDAVAIQYGGSHLVNTMATYRKMNHWQGSSRDMVESFKRYYHNSFLDSQRQEAYNLFLGNYIFAQGQPMLWDLTTDYYLHHADPRLWLERSRRDYVNWYTPSFIQPRSLPEPSLPRQQLYSLVHNGISAHDDYWLEYYRPLAISSFLKIFAFRLNNPNRHPQDKSWPSRDQDLSPFVIRRKQHDHGDQGPSKAADKKPARKGVTIVDPTSESETRQANFLRKAREDAHLRFQNTESPVKQSILMRPHFETRLSLSTPSSTTTFPSLPGSIITSAQRMKNFQPADKNMIHTWTLREFHDNSINPTVTAAEKDEYARYIEHPLNLPLVVSTETPSAEDHPGAENFYEYLNMEVGEESPYPYAHPSHASDTASMAASDHIPHLHHSGRVQPILLPPLDTDLPSLHTHNAAFLRPPSSHSHFSRPTSAAGQSLHSIYSVPFSPYPDAASAPVLHNSQKFRVAEEDVEAYEEFLAVRDRENPLDVLEEDGGKKRYKAYRQWLKGKSFFKQSKVDPEWRREGVGR